MSATRGGREQTTIRVRAAGQDDPSIFEVVLQDAAGETQYRVSMSKKDRESLCRNMTPETCVRATFLFLLDREPKESILSRFDISVVGLYFPEFAAELPKYLDTLNA